VVAGFAIGSIVLVAIVLRVTRPSTAAIATVSGRATIGGCAPEFRTRDLDGRPIALNTYQGHPVLVNFWATWCTACQSEMPLIEQASERYHSQGLTVLAIDYEETNTSAMRDFLGRLGVRFKSLLDPDGVIAGAYGVNGGLPVSVFIDRSGNVTAVQVGQISPEILQQRLARVL